MTSRAVHALPLTRDAFASFGDVIETAGARHFPINGGMCERYHDLAAVQAGGPNARVLISVFRGKPYAMPLRLTLVERHPLGSQAFVPLHPQTRYIVVVATADRRPQAFLAQGVGINLQRNVWHHPLLALDRESDFLVADRAGPGHNCEECELADGPWWLEPLPA